MDKMCFLHFVMLYSLLKCTVTVYLTNHVSCMSV